MENGKIRRYVLTIAGFDPSNGAGLGADIKTFEAFGVYGLAVCTAVTVQNESEFEGVEWVDNQIILQQIEILFRKYSIDVVKIGLLENFKTLDLVVSKLKALNPSIKIIWDPILEASAGFVFHRTIDRAKLLKVAKQCYLLTPNRLEWIRLFSNEIETDVSKKLCNVFLKGGHARGQLAVDVLFTGDETTRFEGLRSPKSKHGTGCVLSAAIAAELTKGNDLQSACRLAKEYVATFIDSTHSLLGNHHPTSIIAGRNTKQMIAMLHLITQDHPTISHAQMAENACLAGAKWIQLRTKGKSFEDWEALAYSTKIICDKYGAKLIINDHVALTDWMNADGVHLGKTDTPPKSAREQLGDEYIIGGTANTMDDIRQLAAAGVDYIGLGPFRFTSTKKNLSPVLGLLGYQTIIEQCRMEGIYIPIIAIGGILPADVKALMQTGIHGVAVASAINLAEDSQAACRAFLEALAT